MGADRRECLFVNDTREGKELRRDFRHKGKACVFLISAVAHGSTKRENKLSLPNCRDK